MTVSALAAAGIASRVFGNFGGGAQASPADERIDPWGADAAGSDTLVAGRRAHGSDQVHCLRSRKASSGEARRRYMRISERAGNPCRLCRSASPSSSSRYPLEPSSAPQILVPVLTLSRERQATTPVEDYAAPNDTPIYAMADGVVIHAGGSYAGRSENTVIIRHQIGGKVYESWYVHMYDHGVLVKEGDTVTAGQNWSRRIERKLNRTTPSLRGS